MLEHAAMWDHFLDYVEAAEREWAVPEDDTDEYRKQRAVELFNLGAHQPLAQPTVSLVVFATCMYAYFLSQPLSSRVTSTS
eukprot:6181549-Pleurochrysis_carterae.AAC.1